MTCELDRLALSVVLTALLTRAALADAGTGRLDHVLQLLLVLATILAVGLAVMSHALDEVLGELSRILAPYLELP